MGVDKNSENGESSMGEVKNSRPGEVIKSDMAGEAGKPRPKECIASSGDIDGGGGIRTESDTGGTVVMVSSVGVSVGFSESIFR